MPVEGEAADFSLMMQQPVCADGGSESDCVLELRD